MPKVVTQADYISGKSDFQSHYFLDNCNAGFDGQDIQLAWDDFDEAVQGFISQYNVDPNIVALRFVHCYDTTKNTLYLRLQVCTMKKRQNEDIYDLDTTNSAWFEITDNSIVATTNTELSDSNYLNNFYYCDGEECSTETLTLLADDNDALFARNLVMPWGLQVAKLYPDNANPQGAKICFGACSFVNTGAGAAYPHELVLYLRDSSGNEMLNDVVGNATYDNKGCDMTTLCPPNCKVYIA